MDKDIKVQIDRAKELLEELKESYNQDLKSKEVSSKSKNLTQEILVKMRSILDQAMYIFFKKEIGPNLPEDEKKKARVYFPISKDLSSLKSTLGRGKMPDLEQSHPDVFKFLESVQPYYEAFEWLKIFTDFANEKHLRLTPQKRFEQERRTVSISDRVKISWTTQDAKFGSGASVMGTRIDPSTQDIPTTPGVESKTEIWVSFLLGDSNINSIWLCETVVKEGEKIISDFLGLF